MNGHQLNNSLIATLGTEPQVVTTSFDILRQDGEKITQVRVLHTYQEGRIAQSISDLDHEFSTHEQYRQVDFRFVPIQDENNQIISDVNTLSEIQAAFRTLYQQVHRVKQNGSKVHLLIAGGRKTLAIYGMVTAQLLLDEGDRLWHLFSEGDFLQSRRMHPKSDDKVNLISIPILQWSNTVPILFDLSDINDPYRALEIQNELKIQEKFEKAKIFVEEKLSPAEERVVELLVRDGLSDEELADELVLSSKTIGSHLEKARRKACFHWGLEKINRTQLSSLLGFYYSYIPSQNQENS